MNQAEWLSAIFVNLANLGEEGRVASEYLRSRRTKIGFWRVRKDIGAFWTFLGTVHLNTHYYSRNTDVNDLGLLTLLIHEVKHLQQGVFLAFSVYGELEAWQLQFRLYHQLTGKPPHPVIAELLSLPLVYDRAVLWRARDLMRTIAGKGYRVDLFPLFPLGQEIRCWLKL